MKRWPSGCSRITSSSGSRPWCRPCARRRAASRPRGRTAAASASRRTAAPAGTFWISGASFGIGAAVFGSIAHAELGGEPHRAQHPHRVLAVARHRRADQPQPPGADVGDAADVVPDRLVGRVEVERVDREVAARGVLGLRAVDVVGDEPAVLVGRVLAGLRGAERRDLERLGADVHVHEPEAPADDERAPEQRLHLLGRGVGRDVEVLGLDAEQQVADGAADDERLEAGVLQLAGDLERAAGQLVAADRVVVRAVDALARAPSSRASGGRSGGGSSRRSRRRTAARGRDGGAACAGAEEGAGGRRTARRAEDGRAHRTGPNGSTRSTASVLDSPGARPSIDQGPTAWRISRSVGSPTAAVIRRTCRLRPSVSVSSSQAVGIALRTRIGGSRGHSPAGSGIDRASAGAVAPVPQLDAGPQRGELRPRRGRPRPGPGRSWAACGAGRRSAPAARRRRSARPAPRCRRRAGRPGRRRGRRASRRASACPTPSGENWHSTPYGLLSSTTRGGVARPARAGRRVGAAVAAWRDSSDSAIINGLPLRSYRRRADRRRRRVQSGRTHVHVPARQGPGRWPEDHRQQGLQPQRPGPADHPVHRGRRHRLRHHAR